MERDGKDEYIPAAFEESKRLETLKDLNFNAGFMDFSDDEVEEEEEEELKFELEKDKDESEGEEEDKGMEDLGSIAGESTSDSR